MNRSRLPIVVLALASTAILYDRTAEAGEMVNGDVQHNWSLTVSPLHLALPMAFVGVEGRLGDKWGLQGHGGVGSLSSEGARFGVYQLGGEFRFYPIGSFIHGMILGGRVDWVYAATSLHDTTATGDGLAAGPIVGYKIATNVGFTFEIYGGAEFIAVHGHAENSAGETANNNASTWVPVLAINLGWSF